MTTPSDAPRHPVLIGGAIAAAALALDQATKLWIKLVVMSPPRVIELTDFANLVFVRNTGVSFGLMNDGGAWNAWLLSGFAVLVCAGLTWWLARAETRLQVPALGLIIGGAIGNVIDRALYGWVIDFIDLHIGDTHWPAFNIADSAICIGAALLIHEALFRRS